MPSITYENRVAKIKSIADLDKQLANAKSYSMRLRRKAVAARTLGEKLDLQAAKRDADAVLHRLRSNYFAIEDTLNTGNQQILS